MSHNVICDTPTHHHHCHSCPWFLWRWSLPDERLRRVGVDLGVGWNLRGMEGMMPPYKPPDPSSLMWRTNLCPEFAKHQVDVAAFASGWRKILNPTSLCPPSSDCCTPHFLDCGKRQKNWRGTWPGFSNRDLPTVPSH